MKKYFSIKTQLILIILTVTLSSSILAFSFSIFYDYKNSQNDLKNNIIFSTNLITENIQSPLQTNDTLGAQKLLLSFKSIPMVLYAIVMDSSDSIFAFYSKTSQPIPGDIRTIGFDTNHFDKLGLHISKSVKHGNQHIGRFVLYASKDAIISKLQINSVIFSSIFLIIMVISYIFALKLQQYISKPILELKNLTEDITHKSDYSIRVPHTYLNEVGLLQKSFDIMVQQLDKNIVSLKQEIDFRIQSQQETLHLREYLKNIIDAISSVIIAVNPDKKITQVNKAALRFLSKTPGELLSQSVTEVLPIIQEKEEFLDICLKENNAQKFPALQSIHKNTQPAHLNIAIFPLSKSENEGVVILIEDVTDKTLMENMMIQNEKMMSLGGLAAGMAHEINNPLGIISQGILNIIRHASPDQQRNREIASEFNIDINIIHKYLEKRKVFHYLDGMLSASKRASEIVSNMLQFSRMSNQSKAPANLIDIVNQTIELAANDYELKKKFDFRQIKICKEYDEKIPELICNITEIQQVILNLLKNSAHALHEKQVDNFIPQITVKIKNEQSHIRLEIEDNGPGIPDELRKRIFEPFFTTKEVGVGTGLGLSVSYFIINKNHSGSIDFVSKIGNGTCFIIRLPFRPLSEYRNNINKKNHV